MLGVKSMLIRKLISMLRPCTLYIKVHKNGFQVRHIENGSELTRHCMEAFSTTRLLVGDFLPAEKCLSELLRELLAGPMHYAAPRVVIHQTEMAENGLSPVEERVLLELAHGAGAFTAQTWVGHELSDAEVRERAKIA
jgi:rod shape-determining protein MreB and related proteins